MAWALLNTGPGGSCQGPAECGAAPAAAGRKALLQVNPPDPCQPQNHASFKHGEAPRGAKKDQWMGMQGSLCSVATTPVWHTDSPNKLGAHSSEHRASRQKTGPD